MEEAYLEKIIEKVNSGVSLEDWFADLENSEEIKEEPFKSFCIVIPRRLWEQIRELPSFKAGISASGRGRPRLHSPKKVFSAILTKAYNASTWREFEELFGIPSTTAYDQFQRWKEAGLFDEIHKLRVQCHRGHHDIEWSWLKEFPAFRAHLEPEKDRTPKVPANKEDEKMYRMISFTARGNPRKNRIQGHILRKIRDHFHRSA